MKIKLLILIVALPMFLMAENVQLPEPQTSGGMPLMEALMARKSTRSYTNQQLTQQQLSNLLWAAWGFNRPDKRTAPSSQNKQEMELYVITDKAVYRYNAKSNILVLIKKGNHREAAGKQEFVKEAPINIVMVANKALMATGSEERQRITAGTDAGYISQNIYLYCASEGLGSVARGSFDRDELRKVLKLNDDQFIVLCQTVGYAK